MSRSFASAGDKVASSSTAIPLTGTVALWVWPTDITTSAASLYYGCVTGGADFFQIYSSTDAAAKFYAGWFVGGSNQARIAAVGNPLNLNTWNVIVCAWTNLAANAGTIECWVNGTSIGSKNTMPTGLTTTTGPRTLGDRAGTLNPFCRMCQFALYNQAWLVNEVNAFGKGASPLRIRPGALVEYKPIFGLQSPEPDFVSGATVGTVTGTTQVNHAPVQPFSRRWWTTMPQTITPSTVLSSYYYQQLIAGGGGP